MAYIVHAFCWIAQEESNSISQNMRWSRQKHIERGQPWDVPRYGYVSVGKEHKWEVVPHEAEVVRQAFFMAGMCHTYGEIAEELTRMEAEDGSGRVWNKTPVVNLLRSNVYHLTHKAIRNDHTEIPSYYIENHHTPIISRSQFVRVQKIRSMRRMQHSRADEVMGACIQYPLGDKLRCPCCGSTLYQRSIPVQSVRGSGWSCERGDDACHSFIMRSNLVEQALLEAYKKLDVNKVCEKLNSPKFGAAAKKTMEIKKENPICFLTYPQQANVEGSSMLTMLYLLK